MRRRQLLGLVVVVALVAAGLLLHRRADSTAAPGVDRKLAALRTAAALQPCPSGLGPDLPDLRLACLGGGQPVALRAAPAATPTLVNLWATWCGPCVREVPVLVAFARRAAGQVAVVGIDTEDEPAQALTFAGQYAMHYPSLVDPEGTVLRAYGGGPPVTLLLDASGRVVYTHRGELHSLAQVDALVADHLGVTLR
jgi:cytochrome c biogenesis protein CcmG/thiol:disulfide interchange protein DsbE